MPGVTEPETGLVFYELSHEWGHGVPTLPGYEEVQHPCQERRHGDAHPHGHA
jgi:hypothetical protein